VSEMVRRRLSRTVRCGDESNTSISVSDVVQRSQTEIDLLVHYACGGPVCGETNLRFNGRTWAIFSREQVAVS
jgi:hypothetical protein